MKKINIIIIFVLSCMLLTSCSSTYQVAKLLMHPQQLADQMNANLERRYQEAKATRPTLTKEQFMAEGAEMYKREQYEKEKAKRPTLTYEEFEAEYNAKMAKYQKK